jgi:hypothetical protein
MPENLGLQAGDERRVWTAQQDCSDFPKEFESVPIRRNNRIGT